MASMLQVQFLHVALLLAHHWERSACRWCGPCKLMYPRLCQMQQQYQDKVRSMTAACKHSSHH